MRYTILQLLGSLIILTGIAAGCSRPGPVENSAATRSQSQPNSPEQLARAKVAQHAGIESSDVEVTEISSIEFPDSSLGCPQPGMAYLQVITPGYRIAARANARDYDVRVSGARALICERRSLRSK